MPSTQDIVQKLWNLCHILRDDGITYLQYVTELPGQELPVTVSLTDHGPRDVTPPAAEETVDGSAHPELLAAVGL